MKKITRLFIFFFYCGFSQTPIPFYQNNPASGTHFGKAVDVFNNEILVSSDSEMLSEPASVGKVYLFNAADGGLQQTNSFYPDDALISDNFGASISINNDFIAIGAPFHDANFENSGAVYLYHKVDGAYQLMQKITASDANPNDNFGSFVKIYNNQLFISAAGDEPDGQDVNANNGSVYVYALVGTEWTYSEKITVAISKHFGQKVDATDNTIVIAFDYPNATMSNYDLYTYVWNNSHWTYESQLSYWDTQQGDNDFSISNNELYVILTGENNMNTIKFFSKVGAAWVGYFQYLTGPDNVLTKIKVNNNTMFLGSTKHASSTERNFPVRILKRNGNYWGQQFIIHGTGPTGQDDYFGSAIASDGNIVVYGAPKEGPSALSGKAYYQDIATLATDDFEKKSSSVYPNPTHDIIYIQNNAALAVLKTEVYSVTGNLLLTTTENSNQISLTKFSKGLYFLKINYKNGSEEVIKIVKN